MWIREAFTLLGKHAAWMHTAWSTYVSICWLILYKWGLRGEGGAKDFYGLLHCFESQSPIQTRQFSCTTATNVGRVAQQTVSAA